MDKPSFVNIGLRKKMADDSLEPLEFKRITIIQDDDDEGEARCECGKEFMYSLDYEENLRQINDVLVRRCPRCYGLSAGQIRSILTESSKNEQKTRRSTKR